MQKSRIILLILFISIFLLSLIFLLEALMWNNNYNKFNYNSAKENATNYLNKNERKLIKLSNELYKNKSYKEKPYKGVYYVSYEEEPEISCWNEYNYIIFRLDAQGMLGGQYYGLIYSKEKNIFDRKKLIIYDEYNETGEGNNIFIRQKIKDNWYFYYNDWDRKVDIRKIN